MSEYEFSEQQNKIVFSFANRMFYFSLTLLLSGIFTLINGFTDEQLRLHYIIAGIALLSVSFTLFFPVDNFKKITTTKGKDITELLTGFTELDKGLNLVIIATFIYMANEVLQFFLAL